MTPADRAAWLARVEGMTREERIEALRIAHTGQHHALGFQSETEWKQCALDLIAALERSAKIEALLRLPSTKAQIRAELRRLRAEGQRAIDRLRAVYEPLERAATDWYSEQQAAAERERQRQLAAARAQEEARLASEAAALEAAGFADEAEAVITSAIEQPSPVLVPTAAPVAPKVDGMGMRDYYCFAIEQPALVPDEYKVIDETRVRKTVVLYKAVGDDYHTVEERNAAIEDARDYIAMTQRLKRADARIEALEAGVRENVTLMTDHLNAHRYVMDPADEWLRDWRDRLAALLKGGGA